MQARATDNVVDITGDGEQVPREELWARQEIQQIPPFPELQTRLTRIFGPGPERDMLHQLIYWFGKPKMQNRWTLYKTFEEWRDERGLNRKQVDNARKRLRPTGIVIEKYGPYKRVHYRVDWLRLLHVLNGESLYPLKGGHSLTDPPKGDSEETVPPKGGTLATVPPKGDSVPTVPPQTDDAPLGNGENPANGGEQSNTGTYAGTYLKNPDKNLRSGDTLLQSGENGFSSRPSPPQKHEDCSPPQALEGQPKATTSFSGEPGLNAELLGEVKEVLGDVPFDNAAEVFKEYREKGFDSVHVMEAVCQQMQVRLCEEMRRHIREAMKQVEATA